MTTPKIVCVVPTVRPECHAAFVEAWAPLFEKHAVTLITVWDGDELMMTRTDYTPEGHPSKHRALSYFTSEYHDLFCRRTDACRNVGLAVAAKLNPDYVLTLDDDCYPMHGPDRYKIDYHTTDYDPIQAHLDALSRRVPLSWMNTAHDTDLYLRGVPYGVRTEAPVMLSHGVWVGVPDFDGETQLRLERKRHVASATNGIPHSLPYYVGPVPRGVLFPLCGMNVMVRRDALPYLYYAPMGVDSGVEHLHRFADIFMGLWVQKVFADRGWACYTGASTVHHTRASDARRNFEQEKLGREWMEELWKVELGLPVATNPPGMMDYWNLWRSKRARYADLINSLLGDSCRPKGVTKT